MSACPCNGNHFPDSGRPYVALHDAEHDPERTITDTNQPRVYESAVFALVYGLTYPGHPAILVAGWPTAPRPRIVPTSAHAGAAVPLA